MNTKIRIRTKQELSIRKKEFLRICNILDKVGLTYFLNTGILECPSSLITSKISL